MRTIDLQNDNILYGDDTASKNLFASVVDGKAYIGDTAGEALTMMRQNNGNVKVKQSGVLHLLHNSLIPASLSPYENLYVLGVGDLLEFDKNDLSAAPRYFCDFPYYEKKSTEKSIPSADTLYTLLCNAVEKSTPKDNAALMVSSGKDSTALALALRECGIEKNVQAFTYGDDPEEALWAKEACTKLGIAHQTVLMPKDPKDVKEAMLNYFTHASHPCCDPALIPYAIILYHGGIKNMSVLDGSNNSIYMGYVPSQKYKTVNRYYSMIGGGWSAAKGLRQMIPYHLKINKMFSTGTEMNLLYKHSHFRDRETQAFYPHNYDTTKFWNDWYRKNKKQAAKDTSSILNGQHFSCTGGNIKGQTAAEAVNSLSVMPWTDKRLIDYYFNLPIAYRYDAENNVSKILLREMLVKYMDFDFSKIGKKIFYFDTQKFIFENLDFVRTEILSCRLWDEKMEKEFTKHLETARKYPRAASALVDLFLISGWHNHCKHLNKT